MFAQNLSTHGVAASAVGDGLQPSSCDNLHHCRTTWNIIWSCLTTILTCTWLAIHPNIPGPNLTPFGVTVRHVRLVVVALIAPELVVSWAMRQWLVAGRLAKEHREYEWVRVHGFFAIMGGFMLFDGREPQYTLRPDSEDFVQLLTEGMIDITEDEIRDKSRRDLLSKIFVLVQTGWFVLQCIARGIQHLPLTELEVVTLAFATLSFVIYGLWLDKPHNVGRPVPVNRSPPPPQENRDNETGIRQGTVARVAISSWARTRNAYSHVGAGIQTVADPRQLALSSPGKAIALFLNTFFRMGGIEDDDDDTFFSGKLKDGEVILVGDVVAAIATIFGGIHCIAWSFHFPSDIEQTGWRWCSVVITSVPGIFIVMRVIWGDVSREHLVYLLGITSVPFLIMSLEYGAYQTVYWTTFIPHI